MLLFIDLGPQFDRSSKYVSQIMPKYTTLLYPTLFLFYGVWHFLIQMRFYQQL